MGQAAIATPAKAAAGPTRHICPGTVQGLRSTLNPFHGRNPQWATLKNSMKSAALAAQWEQFLVGSPDPGRALSAALQPLVEGVPPDQPALLAEATQYAARKRAQKQYVTHANGASKFYSKDTTLTEDIHRTPDGVVFRKPKAISDDHRQAILEQTGVPYTGDGLLGKGANGEVRLAEIIGQGGQCGEMVACKSATGREKDSLRKEAEMIRRLPTAGMFPSIRSAYLGRSNVLVLQDLALGGTSGALHQQIEGSSHLTPQEKTVAHASLAYRCIYGIALLHENNLYHGDIKKNNTLILKRTGRPTRPMFIDYGLMLNPESKTVARLQRNQDRQLLAKMLREVLPAEPVWRKLILQVNQPEVSLARVLELPCLQSALSDKAFTELMARA